MTEPKRPEFKLIGLWVSTAAALGFLMLAMWLAGLAVPL